MSVAAAQRFTKDRRCPICGGCEKDQRGAEKRCHGYLSTDGKYAHCARVECGEIENGDTWAHRLTGPCACGLQHGEPIERPSSNVEYIYQDAQGNPYTRVTRTPAKDFFQARYVAGRWENGLKGTKPILYRLPELVAAPKDTPVYIVEGEKDVETMLARGLVATCNPMGAEKWRVSEDCSREHLRGRHLVLVSDDDSKGRKHMSQVAASMSGVAASVRQIALYPEGETKKDVSDWFAEGHTPADLEALTAGEATTGVTADPWQEQLTKALDDVRRALGKQQTSERKPLFGIDATALLKMAFAAVVWLVTGLVTRGGTAVIAGEPKAGIKTWMLIEQAIAIATGTPMFGEFPAQAGVVAFFFAEDQAQSIRNRVRALLAASGRRLEAGRLFLQPRGEFIDVLQDEDLAWIIASVRSLPTKIDLLVLDPLRDVHSGEEDKSDSMRDVMRRLRVLGEILGCTVSVSHHTPKQTKDTAKRRVGQNLRGSSAIHGSIDAGIYVEPADGDGTSVFAARVTSQVKSGRSAGVFDLKLAIVDDANGEAISAQWTFSRAEFKQGPKRTPGDARDESDDLAAMAFVRQLAAEDIYLSRTDLRNYDGHPIPEKRMTAAIDRLLACNELRLIRGKVHCTQVQSTEEN